MRIRRHDSGHISPLPIRPSATSSQVLLDLCRLVNFCQAPDDSNSAWFCSAPPDGSVAPQHHALSVHVQSADPEKGGSDTWDLPDTRISSKLEHRFAQVSRTLRPSFGQRPAVGVDGHPMLELHGKRVAVPARRYHRRRLAPPTPPETL